MWYRLLADATMVAHFAFLVFVVLGGFLAWRWPWTIALHLLAAAWGLLIVLFSWDCPLTWVEAYFRRKAGGEGLPGGFIDHYIEGVIYPERHATLLRVLAAGVVVLAWVGAYLRWRNRRATSLTRAGKAG